MNFSLPKFPFGKKFKKENAFNMNADCWLEIFQYLNAKDIISMSEVNHIFDEIILRNLLAGLVFSADNFTSFESLNNFLRKFSPSITNIRIGSKPHFFNRDNFSFQKYLINQIDVNHVVRLDIALESGTPSENLTYLSEKFQQVQHFTIRATDEQGDKRKNYYFYRDIGRDDGTNYNMDHENDFPLEKEINLLLSKANHVKSLTFVKCDINFDILDLSKFDQIKRLTFIRCKCPVHNSTSFQNAFEMIGKTLIEFNVNKSPFCEPICNFCNWPVFYSKLVAQTAPNLVSLNLSTWAGCGPVNPNR